MDNDGEDLHPVQDADTVQLDVQEGVGVLRGAGREVTSASEDTRGAHTQGKHGGKGVGRTEVCKGDGEKNLGMPLYEHACCTVLKVSFHLTFFFFPFNFLPLI